MNRYCPCCEDEWETAGDGRFARCPKCGRLVIATEELPGELGVGDEIGKDEDSYSI